MDTKAKTYPGNSKTIPLQTALSGCLAGCAVGDALGLPFEGLPPHRIQKLRPIPLQHRFFFGKGMVSDDTEHTCFTAQALIRSGGDPVLFQRKQAWAMRWWFLGLPAGVGLATLRACSKLLLGWSGKNSGVFSAGNGPAMRSAVIGVFAGENEELLRELIRVNTRLTHTDPKAEKGALIVAKAAAIASRGIIVEPAGVLDLLQDYCGGDEELTGLLQSAAHSANIKEPAREFCQRIGLDKGVSGYIYHTLPVVLQIWLRHQNDFKSAIEEVISCGGDTDTVGAIVGGIIGAGTGTRGIPADWLDNIMEKPRDLPWMYRLARELAHAKNVARPAPATGLNPLAVMARNIFFTMMVLAHGFRRLLPPY